MFTTPGRTPDAAASDAHGARPAGTGDDDQAQPLPQPSSVKNGPLHDEEVVNFPTPCPDCHATAETSMRVSSIPHFGEVIIMCLACEKCGYKSSEIKGGGGGDVASRGTKITLRVNNADDLKRDVVKSDTAGVSIPELDLALDGGSDGAYTTVEGLLKRMHDRLRDGNPFGRNDGDRTEEHAKFDGFLKRLEDMAEGRLLPFTLILTDPLSNSFVGPRPMAGEEPPLGSGDEGLTIDEYERTEMENERLGLHL